MTWQLTSTGPKGSNLSYVQAGTITYERAPEGYMLTGRDGTYLLTFEENESYGGVLEQSAYTLAGEVDGEQPDPEFFDGGYTTEITREGDDVRGKVHYHNNVPAPESVPHYDEWQEKYGL